MLPVLPSVSAHHVHLESNSHGSSQRNQNSTTTTKRNSSMIFRIEHLLPAQTTSEQTSFQTSAPETPPPPPTTQLSSDLETYKSEAQFINQFSGLYAAEFIAKDTLSNAVSTPELISGLKTADEDALHQQHQRASKVHCILKHSRIHMTAYSMRRIKLSEDINSYNILFELDGGSVRMRTVRDINTEEELVAWFTEEISLLMSIPFLTPLNIQGNKRYTCHVCQLTFESPNPLKIHLALACGRNPIDILWLRLHYAVRATHLNQHILTTLGSGPVLTPTMTLTARLPMSAAISTTATCSRSRSTCTTLLSHPHHRHYHQPHTQQHISAFKPISPSSTNTRITSTPATVATSNAAVITTASLSLPLLSHHTQTVTSPALSFLPSMSTPAAVAAALNPMGLLQPPNPTSSLNAAAQIEAIVSNMGASKQGHLCIYCGKVYSRKYGLKIHIRTHTGFKPLKCKFCLRPFGDPSNLNKHVRLHLQSGVSSTASASASATTTSSPGGGDGDSSNAGVVLMEGYKCHLCHKTLARRRDLQRHMEARHSSAAS